ncbi:MAG: hypothetical protein LBE79_06475 [Tannerella sp.]|jgi:hypothetical protein|nr:hypothetical protein [Tannerella sp.]
MKNLIYILTFCSFFLTCCQTQREPEVIIEEPEEPCGCCNVVAIGGYIWYRELSVWNYPFNLNPNLWAGLTTLEKMDDYHIPDDILKTLTTANLVEICCQYPFLFMWCGLMHISPDMNPCLDDAISRFNGFDELYKREDTAYELLKRYDDLVEHIAVVCSIEGSELVLYADLEVLLGRYHKSDDDAVDIYREILRHLVEGYEAKILFPDVFSDFASLMPNFKARMNIIEKISPCALSPVNELIMIWGLMPDYKDFINELSYELIK